MVPEESHVKYTILLAGILGMLGLLSAACVVDAGVGGGGTGCDAVACGDALANGGVPCDSVSASEYDDLQSCGCPVCPECGDNFCSDLGETGACGDCLDANCGPEHTTCAND